MAEVQLTKEQKERLKEVGCLGFELKDQWPYVPKAYRKVNNKGEHEIPKELWPVFILKGLDGIESSLMSDKLHSGIKISTTGSTSMELNRGNVMVETCRLGIVTWKNYRDSKFKLIPIPEKNEVEGGITKNSLRVVPPELLTELTNAITEHTRLVDEELLGLEL